MSLFGSKKQLAVFLSKLRVFETPDIRLEQYPTDGEVAASILWDASMQNDLEDKHIADFGCGTGILGIGALAMGAKHVVFIELDQKVFPILMANLHFLEAETDEIFSNYEIIQGNIENYDTAADVVLQNPPFGTKEAHADMMFLKKAVSLAPIVYSLHKTSTEQYIREWADRNRLRITNIQRFEFPLKQSMQQHTKKITRIEVSSFKFQS